MRGAPTWLALLAALPDDAVPECKPVASPELIASGKADAIVGWDSITINLSAGDAGFRHLQVTVDATGRLLSAGDHVLFHRTEERGGLGVTITIRKALVGGTRMTARSRARGGKRIPNRTTSTPMTSRRSPPRRRRRRPRTSSRSTCSLRRSSDVAKIGIMTIRLMPSGLFF